MDALKRPLRIPPEFGRYAEEKGMFQTYERMLQELIVTRPEDPLQFLADYLDRQQDDVPRVIIYGPPASGRHTISKLAARKLKAVHVQPNRVLVEDKSAHGKEARSLRQAGKEPSPSLWAQLLNTRLQQQDCVSKGWVLEGYPRTREQALALQAKGILPKHLVHLEASDCVLVERYSGKRVDSLTGDVYHLVFSPPKSQEVASRLVEEKGGADVNLHTPLSLYHRHSDSLLSCYAHRAKKFNADQPVADLFAQVYSFLCTVHRSNAPFTPRVVLLGPTGSGKSLQATQLSKKYGLVDVDCRELINQTLRSGSNLADQMKPFHDRKMLIPDDMVMQVVSRRLSQLDCTTRGWVLHGFPLTRDQAEMLTKSGYVPNRVIFLDITEDAVRERLSLRRVDPVTGERYHLLFKAPPSQDVKDRLVTYPRDQEEKVAERVSSYLSYVEDLWDYYDWGQHINADQDPLTVFESLESCLVNPLPNQPPPATGTTED